MKNFLIILVTLIDLLTAWPFQNTPLRVLDVVIGLALLALLVRRSTASRKAEYFGVGERVRLARGYPSDMAADAHTFGIIGTVLGASVSYDNALRVKFDNYAYERQIPVLDLEKVSLFFQPVVAPPPNEKAQAQAYQKWAN